MPQPRRGALRVAAAPTSGRRRPPAPRRRGAPRAAGRRASGAARSRGAGDRAGRGRRRAAGRPARWRWRRLRVLRDCLHRSLRRIGRCGLVRSGGESNARAASGQGRARRCPKLDNLLELPSRHLTNPLTRAEVRRARGPPQSPLLRHRCRNQVEAPGRRHRRRDRRAQASGHRPQGPLPVPRREDSVVHRHARPRDVALLRLRRARRHLHVPDASRRARLPRGADPPGREGGRRAQRAQRPRGSAPAAPARGARGGHRAGTARCCSRRTRPSAARAYLAERGLSDETLERFGDRLRAQHLGGDDQAPARQGLHRCGADRRRARQPVEPRRRVRPLPRPNHHPDPRRVGPRDRPRRADPARRGGAEVPELAGDGAVRQEPDPVRDRPRQGRHPAREAGRHRRGLYRRDGRPPGRLRQRGRQPRDGAHRRTGRARQPIRRCGRPRLRRRPGRRDRHAARPARGARAGA